MVGLGWRVALPGGGGYEELRASRWGVGSSGCRKDCRGWDTARVLPLTRSGPQLAREVGQRAVEDWALIFCRLGGAEVGLSVITTYLYVRDLGGSEQEGDRICHSELGN